MAKLTKKQKEALSKVEKGRFITLKKVLLCKRSKHC
jgi:hypothetical protein